MSKSQNSNVKLIYLDVNSKSSNIYCNTSDGRSEIIFRKLETETLKMDMAGQFFLDFWLFGIKSHIKFNFSSWIYSEVG